MVNIAVVGNIPGNFFYFFTRLTDLVVFGRLCPSLSQHKRPPMYLTQFPITFILI